MTFILAFAGVEASGSHINELQKPERNYLLAMGILVAIVIVLDAMGGIAVAEIGSWIVGPSAGLQTTSEYGVMPRWVRKTNKHGVPTNMIVAQTVVVMWDAILTFGSGNAGNVSFLVATTLTTLIYLVCYFLMYASYFRLIFTGKDLHRTYNVPGGIVGKTIVAVCSTITSIIAFVMSFTPSSALPSDETSRTWCFWRSASLSP